MESCYTGQWESKLPKNGRRIIMSSLANQKSYFGMDGSGGEYSNQYAEATKDLATERPPDGNQDGFADPGEIHKGAVKLIQRPQIPKMVDETCDCVCAIGGMTELIANDSGSATPYAAIASGKTAVLIIVVGGWHIRKRRLLRRY